MNSFHQWKSRIFFVYCLLMICLIACSYTRYHREPLPGLGKPVDRPVVIDPIATANVLLKPKSKEVIVIDPGHGGKDFGTYSRKTPKYQEKFLNLTTAYMVRNFLEQLGYTVILTRKNDSFLSLDDRAIFANKLKPRLFVSLHYNSAPNREAEGIEVYYYRSGKDPDRSANSKKLAQMINKGIINSTEAKSRGVKHGDLAVIRETNMPAVLVEGGFLTNENEVVKLKDAAYLKKLSWGIAQGINEYLEKNPSEILAK